MASASVATPAKVPITAHTVCTVFCPPPPPPLLEDGVTVGENTVGVEVGESSPERVVSNELGVAK